MTFTESEGRAGGDSVHATSARSPLIKAAGQEIEDTKRSYFGWVVYPTVIVLLLLFGSSFQMFVATLAVIYAISALGLDLVMGRAGMLSIGNAALMGVGAYTTAILGDEPWAPFPLPVVFAVGVGAIVGLIVGLPSLRLRSVYLALATLALHFIVLFVGQQYQASEGAISGLRVPRAEAWGLDLSSGAPALGISAIILGMVVVLLTNVYRGAPGRLLLSIRESQLAAGAVGVGVVRWKLMAFVLSSSLVALSGSMLAYFTRSVSFETFSLTFAISFIVMVVIGGEGTIGGPILGAAVVAASPHLTSYLTERAPAFASDWLEDNVFHLNHGIYGLLLIAVLLYRPAGLISLVLPSWRWRRSKEEHGRGPEVNSPELPERYSAGSASLDEVETTSPARVVGVRSDVATPDDQKLLEIVDLHVRYGSGADAVSGLSLVVPEGQIVALLGRNGAGKSSTLRAVSGFFPTERATHLNGSISFEGEEIRGIGPIETASRGITLLPEQDKVFASISTSDHLRMVSPGGQLPDGLYDLFPRLQQRANLSAGLLSGGERQMLALALAWTLRPKLLLVDELSLGLAPMLVRDSFEQLETISREEGMAVLLVEQQAAAALAVADFAYIMESGVLVASGTPQELQRSEAVRSAYLGE